MKLGIEIHPNVFSGKPCMAGSRIPAGQLIAEIAHAGNVDDVADNYEIEVVQLCAILETVAAFIDRYYTNPKEEPRFSEFLDWFNKEVDWEKVENYGTK